ncbi:hypothetical protein Dsin_032545 [Dipteronia sinensis]|uniref:DUF4283 domain-containing protein n=1 Tax=Dipteronia sinensis TaxID=43782 RepID=A0AAD9ZCP6_9ROSI|nr:hypothetical protein Dsin_032545 [Dipteronia sinensis]
MKSMSWRVQTNVEVWLSRCAVDNSIPDVNKRLSSRGFSFSNSFLSDKRILWSLETEFEKEGFIRNRFFWDDRFVSIERWSKTFSPFSRLAWIEVFGIPLDCWCSDFFKKLGNLLGSYLTAEEDTFSNIKRLDRGRMLVQIPLDQAISKEIKVKVGRWCYGGQDLGRQKSGGHRLGRSISGFKFQNYNTGIEQLAAQG